MNDPKNKLGQYAGLEQLSTQALEDLLQQDFAAGEDHSNPDLVMAIMEVMEQRTPQAAPAVDVDAAWNAFRAGKIAPMEPEADAAGPLPEAVPVPPSAAPQKPRRRKAPRRALALVRFAAHRRCFRAHAKSPSAFQFFSLYYIRRARARKSCVTAAKLCGLRVKILRQRGVSALFRAFPRFCA